MSSIDPRVEIIILGGQWEKVVFSGIVDKFYGQKTFLPTLSRQIVVYTGTYQRSLDDKLRVLLPKRLRAGFSGLGMEKGAILFLTPGTDHCLELHTTQSLNELALRANQSPAGSKSVRSFSRLFYAQAQQCDVDKQGRIRIPHELARLADLTKEIVFIGVGFHWELWKLDLWESYLKENQDGFDQITETTLDASLGTIETPTPVRTQRPVVDSDHFALMAMQSMSVQQKSKPK